MLTHGGSVSGEEPMAAHGAAPRFGQDDG